MGGLDIKWPAVNPYEDTNSGALSYDQSWGQPPSGLAGSRFGGLWSANSQSPLADTDRVLAILRANQDKNFVQRHLNPDPNVRLDAGVDAEGNPQYATEQMSWGTTKDGRHIVYPNIVQKPGENKLTWLKGNEPIQYALKTGEFIEFPTPEEADWFSSNHYKLGGHQ